VNYSTVGRSNLSVSKICLLTGKTQVPEGSRTRQVEGEYASALVLTTNSLPLSPRSAARSARGEHSEHSVAIAWTLHNPAVASAIVGVRTVEQLDGFDRAAELELSPEVMNRLDEIFDINHGRALQRGPAPEAYAW